MAASDLEAGFAAQSAGRYAEARQWYERDLAADPVSPRALFLLGTLAITENRIPQAISLLEKCIGVQPRLSIAHNSLGNAWHVAREILRAAAAYQGAIDCPAPCVEAFCNLGAIRRSLGQLDEAVSLYRRAVQIKPGFAEAWCNLGVALKELKQLSEASAAFRQATKLNPNLDEAHFNDGLLLLLTGDLREGWRKHEYRWSTNQRASRRNFAQPLWLGKTSLEGRTILVHAEQGLGDTLQFVRYLPLLKGTGARILLEVQPALKALLAHSTSGVELYAKGEVLPDFDVQCPMLSLPLAFSTQLDSIPSDIPYLQVPPALRGKWDERLIRSTGPRVGLAWFGNRGHKNDRNRSIPSEAIARFVAQSPVVLHCLQKDFARSEDAAIAASAKMLCFNAAITDFSETAAFVERLDLVISVDTSVAHLAGGMGKPLWVLLPYVPDWRWLLDRDDSLWYPSARLFRQPSPKNWDAVLAKVRTELELFCANWRLAG